VEEHVLFGGDAAGEDELGFVGVAWEAEFLPHEVEIGLHEAEEFGEEEPEEDDEGEAGDEACERVVEEKGEEACDEDVFGDAGEDVRERFRGGVDEEAETGFGEMRGEAGDACEDACHDLVRGVGGAHDVEGEEDGAGGADDGVEGVPETVDPWDFIDEGLEQEEQEGDGHDGWVGDEAEDVWSADGLEPAHAASEACEEGGEVEIDA
jgi:hypothetical protein